MKLILFGATGTGKTTLGKSLSKKLSWTFLDSDDYYWEKTEPPFEIKIPLAKRNGQLKAAFEKEKMVIVSGSLCTWSKYWDTAFDLGVFLRLPKQVRMERLAKRERKRYGETLKTDKAIQTKSIAFLEWAQQYDEPTSNGHSITQHRNWIKDMSCPVVEINGDLTNEERVTIVLKEIQQHAQREIHG